MRLPPGPGLPTTSHLPVPCRTIPSFVMAAGTYAGPDISCSRPYHSGLRASGHSETAAGLAAAASALPLPPSTSRAACRASLTRMGSLSPHGPSAFTSLVRMAFQSGSGLRAFRYVASLVAVTSTFSYLARAECPSPFKLIKRLLLVVVGIGVFKLVHQDIVEVLSRCVGVVHAER